MIYFSLLSSIACVIWKPLPLNFSGLIVNAAVLLLPSVFKEDPQQLFAIDKVKYSVPCFFVMMMILLVVVCVRLHEAESELQFSGEQLCQLMLTESHHSFIYSHKRKMGEIAKK